MLCSSKFYSLASIIIILCSKQNSSHPSENSRQSSQAVPVILYACIRYTQPPAFSSSLSWCFHTFHSSINFSLELTPTPKMLRDYSERRVPYLYACPKFPQATDFQTLPSKCVSTKTCPTCLECFAILSGTLGF